MSGMLSKIMPARAQAEQQATPKLIADLDQLMPEPLGFKYQGRVYQIQVGTVRRLAKMSEQWSVVMDLLSRKNSGESISDVQLYREYHKYISVLCPDLTLGVVESMSYPMLKALLKEVVRYATGQQTEEIDAEKKKMI